MFQANRGSGNSTAAFDVVAMTASLGGLKAFEEVLGALPADFPAPIVVLQHVDPASHELLSGILRVRTRLRVECVQDGEVLLPGTVYTVHPGFYPQVCANLTVSLHPKHLKCRPADSLLESVAQASGRRSIAVVLSGMGSDGARGVCAVKRAGGRVLVQDERSALHFGMPSAAIGTGCVDFVMPPKRIAAALVALVMVEGAAEYFKVAIPAWSLAS
ncbi:MAG TPA: chemotaxis protein CheB [Candidatus Binatia bacterium]|jgi:two-component system chemotaxis response regulator CheB